ncbi:MAG: hypothetical protein ACOX3M_08105 [Saccharofermentanales bacterium]|jgi:hypothetical protein
MYRLLIYFSLFPFVSFFNMGTDTQPYAFLTGIGVIFLTRKHKIPKEISPLLMLSFFSVLVFLAFGNFEFTAIRSMFNYVSLGVITYASYLAFENVRFDFEKNLKLVINIWFVVGFIQKYVSSSFLLFMVAGGRTTATRGVPHLTSEPSFYAYMLMFALMFVMDFKRHRNLYILNLAIQLVFFSQSAIGFVYASFYVLLNVGKYLFNHKSRNVGKALLIIVIILGLGYLYLHLYPASRASKLITRIIQNPLAAYSIDRSVQARVNHIYFSIRHSVNSFFVPQGYGKSLEIIGSSRIMSGFGAALFELGFMGIVVIVSIFKIIFGAKEHNNRFLNSLFITSILFSAIQLASPTLALYLGYLVNLQKQSVMKESFRLSEGTLLRLTESCPT